MNCFIFEKTQASKETRAMSRPRRDEASVGREGFPSIAPKKNIGLIAMSGNVLKKIVGQVGTPLFVYHEKRIIENIERVYASAERYGLHKRVKLYVAYFTNSHPYIFRIIKDAGAGILIQTDEEYHHLKKFNLDSDLILSPSVLSDEEITQWRSRGVPINLSSIEEVRSAIEAGDKEVSFRVDPTWRGKQRTGIKRYQLRELKELLDSKSVSIKTIHIYIGTGSELGKVKRTISKVLRMYQRYFPSAKEINLGGGFAFDYVKRDPREKHFDWDAYFAHFQKQIHRFKIPNSVQFILEPGRDILADTGVFVVSVKRIVKLKNIQNIAINGSYVYMPSATIRARQHNLDYYDNQFRPVSGKSTQSTLSGCTTLSSDYLFPGSIDAPEQLSTGGYIVINDIGAYGANQHMEFLNKRPVPEILITKNGEILIITERGEQEDRLRYVLPEPKKL